MVGVKKTCPIGLDIYKIYLKTISIMVLRNLKKKIHWLFKK